MTSNANNTLHTRLIHSVTFESFSPLWSLSVSEKRPLLKNDVLWPSSAACKQHPAPQVLSLHSAFHFSAFAALECGTDPGSRKHSQAKRMSATRAVAVIIHCHINQWKFPRSGGLSERVQHLNWREKNPLFCLPTVVKIFIDLLIYFKDALAPLRCVSVTKTVTGGRRRRKHWLMFNV